MTNLLQVRVQAQAVEHTGKQGKRKKAKEKGKREKEEGQ